MLGWTQRDLSDRSGVSVPTIKRLEALSGALRIRLETLTAVERALTDARVQFIDENGGPPGVRFAPRQRQFDLDDPDAPS